jgi:hypothetical protein
MGHALTIPTGKRLVTGKIAKLFVDGFESPVVSGYSKGTLPDNGYWVGSDTGFGSDRKGMNNADGGDWVASGSDNQGLDCNYTNSGFTTVNGAIGVFDSSGVTYRFTITVAYDKNISQPDGLPSGDYNVYLGTFDDGNVGGVDRQDWSSTGETYWGTIKFITLQGTVLDDDGIHTIVGEYTTDPVTDAAREGVDLAIGINGATSNAIITSVKVEVISMDVDLWSPELLTTISWYDALDSSTITESGGSVSQWDDKSGNNNHATQSPGSLQPTYDSVNNEITFDGSDILEVTNDPFKDLQNFAVLAVGQWTSSVENANVFASFSSAGSGNTSIGWSFRQRSAALTFTLRPSINDLGGGIPALGTDFVGAVIRDPSNNIYSRLNGTQTYSASNAGTIDYTATNRSALGGVQRGDNWTSPDFYLRGSIKELIVVDGATVADVQKAEGYLAWKWGLVGNLPGDHPYKYFAPVQRPWTPTEIATTAWFDAADSNTITDSSGAVSQWDDKSGNGRDVSQPSGSDQPTTGIRTIGELNAIDFDGVGDYLIKADADVANIFQDGKKIFVFTIADLEIGSDAAMLAYFSDSGGTTGGSEYNGFGGGDILEAHMGLDSGKTDPFIMNEDGAARAIATGSLLDQNPHMLMGVFDRTASTIGAEIWLDGTLEAMDTDSPKSSKTCDTFIMGRTAVFVSDRLTDGGVGEVIIAHDIDESTRQKLEGYLAWKWGLVGNLPSDHPYKNFAPVA